ncbi:MAG TPA: DEAD/DEAH box helicase, partial [Kiloniellaceae bacterium]|nr:DEAD/DEAH box helicase [Kiloniellaceae bacterium]
MVFEDLGLSPEVLKAVEEVGYSTPTPIQEKAIPVVLMGRDVLGCAQTGTGKTAGFTLPMIDILSSGRARARMPRSLIIAPTRELAAQVSENFELYGKYGKLSMALLIGGSSFVEQEQKLDRGVDVLIATPGRLIDLFERGKILLADVKILVIDEADRMLDMGFMPDVERIVGLLPKIRQTLFFSATMPPEIRRLADSFLMNPKEISVDPPASAAETVTQGLLKVRGAAKEKRAALRDLIRSEEVKSALVFCNRKRDVDIVFRSMQRHGFSVAALHGDMAQPVRMETLQTFKDGEVQFLVCSDVAARGLDIPAVSHVFNFDVPSNPEDYVHRIGRTGRAGRSGKAFTLALPEEGKYLASVVRIIGKEIPEVALEGAESWDAGEAEEQAGRRRRGSTRRGSRAAAGKSSEGRGRKDRGDRSRRDRGRGEKDRGERDKNQGDRSAQDREVVSFETAAEQDTAKSDRDEVKGEKREPRRSKQKQGDDTLAPGETAFGDHIPAFLLRP